MAQLTVIDDSELERLCLYAHYDVTKVKGAMEALRAQPDFTYVSFQAVKFDLHPRHPMEIVAVLADLNVFNIRRNMYESAEHLSRKADIEVRYDEDITKAYDPNHIFQACHGVRIIIKGLQIEVNESGQLDTVYFAGNPTVKSLRAKFILPYDGQELTNEIIRQNEINDEGEHGT